MKSTKKTIHGGHGGLNADLLDEAGGDYEMAFYKAKHQLDMMSATVNHLTQEKAKLLEEKDTFGRSKLTTKYEDMERDSNL